MDVEQFSNNMSSSVEEEAHIEQLLSEKLMDGYVLLENACPVCSTPLVKNHANADYDNDSASRELKPVMVPAGSFGQPFKPVPGVPFCVACCAHVVTQEDEISILERCDSLKAKGGVLVAMQESASSAETSYESGTREDTRVDRSEGTSKSSRTETIIDVTKMEEPTVDHYPEEKKEEYEPGSTVKTDDEDMMPDYSVRRQIATKVLGAKMLQGYTLKEKQCEKCGMPMMEHRNRLECVVCPALARKAKKKLKAQQRLAHESSRLEHEIKAAKAKKVEEEAQALQAAAHAERLRREEEARMEQARLDRERQEFEMQQRLEKELQQARQLATQRDAAEKAAVAEAAETRLMAEAQARAEQEARQYEAQVQANLAKGQQEKARLEELRQRKAATVESEYAAAVDRRWREEQELLDETKRLEEMERRRKMGLSSASENMQKDRLTVEHRKRLEQKSKLDEEILRLEEERLVTALESRKVAEEERAEAEARMLATLEEEASAKAEAAEEAIRKAKAALEHVSSARREVIAQTIALAEQEAVAEAEDIIQKECELHKERMILPTPSEVRRENWETLRVEGRSVMTRRVMAGWVLVAEFCKGEECHNSPLITKDGQTECVVCGGCGDGTGGAYAAPSYDVVESADIAESVPPNSAAASGIEGFGYEIQAQAALPPPTDLTFDELQGDFETKRSMVSREIGKRMVEGWTLLDTSCPNCVMPLMMDKDGTPDICILCGLVDTMQHNDGSTVIKSGGTAAPTQVEQRAVPKMEEIETPRAPSMEEEAPEVEDRSEQIEIAGQRVAQVPSAEETSPFPAHHGDDEHTMDSTLPTLEEGGKASLPAGPTFEERSQNQASTLSESIRQNAMRSVRGESPRADPPASLKVASQRQRAAASDPEEVGRRIVPSASTRIETSVSRTASDLGPVLTKPSGETVDAIKVDRASGATPPQATAATPPEAPIEVSLSKHMEKSVPESPIQSSVLKAIARAASEGEYGQAVNSRDLKHSASEGAPLKKQPTTPIQAVVSQDKDDGPIRISMSVDKDDVNPINISIAKDYDLTSKENVDKIVDVVRNAEESEVIEVTNTGEIYAGKEAMSPEALSKLILDGPMGYDVQDASINALKDLIDVYMSANFGETVSDEVKAEVARLIKEKTAAAKVLPAPQEDGIIHLEDMPGSDPPPITRVEPQTFRFDDFSVDNRSVSSSKKSKPTPETMTRERKSPRALPPRPKPTPDATRRIPSARTPPNRRASPRNKGFVVEGGPADFNDGKSLGEMSRASSVATDALDSILARIEQCQTKLMQDDISLETQLATAALIEKLASAAVAVKKLETLDD